MPTRVWGRRWWLSFYCIPTRVGEEGLNFYFVPTRVGGRACFLLRAYPRLEEGGAIVISCARACSLFYFTPPLHSRVATTEHPKYTAYLPASGVEVAPANLCSLFFTPLRAYPRMLGGGLPFISCLPAYVGRWLAFYFVPTRVWEGGAIVISCASACSLFYPPPQSRVATTEHPKYTASLPVSGRWVGLSLYRMRVRVLFFTPPTFTGCHYRTSEIYCVTARAAKERRASGRASLRHLRQE